MCLAAITSALAVYLLLWAVIAPPPSQAAFSGSNGKIAFTTQRDGNEEIYSMNTDGTGATNLTGNSANDGEPAWSPDGSKLVFRSMRDNNHEIYVMNADGSAQTRLTNNSAIDMLPSWSPDGTKITFTSRRDGNDEIYVMNADGSNQTNLTNNANSDAIGRWSPDSSQIVFHSNRSGVTQIYVMNDDGSNVTQLTNTLDGNGAPTWSPDGSKIAFYSLRDGTGTEIYVMNADGSNPTRLTNNTEADSGPAWSPDGTKIVFDSTRDGNYEIYVMDADGASQSNLTNHSNVDLGPDWQPIPLNTPTPSNTPTDTLTPTNTNTPGPTDTPTETPTSTNTFTPTNTPTATNTLIPAISCPGPDGYGYTCSNVSASFVPVGSNLFGGPCSNCSVGVGLPFQFTFYGQSYNSAYITSNGTIHFSGISPNPINTALPTANFGPTIFAYWDALVPGSISDNVYMGMTGTSPNRTVIFEWRYREAASGFFVNVEAQLHETSNQITLIYNIPGSNGSSATAGIQQAYSANNLQLSYNQAVLTPGRAVRFSPPVPPTATPTPTRTPRDNPLNSVTIVSDSSVRAWDSYTGTPSPGWHTVGYDDSSWTNAVQTPCDAFGSWPPPHAGSQWIWHSNCITHTSQQVYFRKTFSLLPGASYSGSISINADDQSYVYINGNLVGATSNWQVTGTFNLSPYLTSGENVLIVDGRNLGGPGGVTFIANVTVNSPVNTSTPTTTPTPTITPTPTATNVPNLCTAIATGLASNSTTWDCGHVPQAGDSILIPNGRTVDLDVSLLDLKDVTIESGANLKYAGSALTLSLTGNLSNSGLFIPETAVTVRFKGATAQVLSGAGTTFYDLFIENSGGGVIFNSSVTVRGTLNLTNDLTVSAPYTLNQQSASVGTGDVVGSVIRKTTSPNIPMSFGNPMTQLTFENLGTLPQDVTVTLSRTAPGGLSNAIARVYSISANMGSNYEATLQLHYTDAEVASANASEGTLQLFRYSGSAWQAQGGTVNTSSDFVSLTDVSQFSNWAISSGAPTAIELVSFEALGENKGIRVKWETGLEFDLVGFNVWRKVGKHEWQKLNTDIIPAKKVGQVGGARYRFLDKQISAGKTYRYKIELLKRDGQSTMSSVVKVRMSK
ncbi:MAG: hypothetical protein DCC52_00405 [Chloroflexi bacterium]|nr:MAG: hypothetical protein DCC52_00405 [Chloroflexota bacterium]